MKIKSAKAKGRRAASELRGLILKKFTHLNPEDIVVTPSSSNGPDLTLSSLARAVIPFSIECKNTERLNIWAAIEQAAAHGDKPPLVVFRKNREPLYVTLPLASFLSGWQGEVANG